MEKRELGRSGIAVSRICLGTMTWGEQNTEAEAHAQIAYAFDHGVNFMDTAELYPTPGRGETQGRTEEYIGNWFKSTGRREDWILASKITGPGNDWIREGQELNAQEIVRALELNLKRLQTDYIDLYQLHWPNRPHYNFDRSWTFEPSGQDRQRVSDNLLEILAALDAQVKAGKIRAIGVSNETAWGLLHYLTLAERHGLTRMATIQNEYNLLRRGFDLDLAEVCALENVGLLAYSPLASGILSGKYNDGHIPKGSRGDIGNLWRLNSRSEAATKAYIALAQDHGLDPCQMAIAYCLTKPFMSSVIIGATNTDQLADNISAAGTTLGEDVLAGIEAIHRAYPRTI